jgi:hypothetical protein
MEKAFDIYSVLLTLRKGVEKGYWTVEQLDEPSSGWRLNARSFALHYPKYKQPTYRNLLRDEPTPTERVEIVSPRDFAVVEAVTDPVQRGSAPLPMAADRPVAESFSDASVQGHERRMGDEADYGDETHLGATWEGGASGVGDVSDDW